MSKPAILSCDEVLWDLFPDGPRFGGAPADFACHTAVLGGAVSLLSAVGEDVRGGEAFSILRGFGIDSSLIQRNSDAPTGSVGVSLDAAGKPTFDIKADSAWDHIAWNTALASRIDGMDAIYFGTLSQRRPISRATSQRMLRFAKTKSLLRVLDVNFRQPFFDAALIRESLALASVLKLSDVELPEVAAACGIAIAANPEDTLHTLLLHYQLDLVALTRGADGARLVSATETVDQPGIPIPVRDTVGAGDSFTAALAMGLLHEEPLPVIALAACRTASAVCAQSGAVPEFPTHRL